MPVFELLYDLEVVENWWSHKGFVLERCRGVLSGPDAAGPSAPQHPLQGKSQVPSTFISALPVAYMGCLFFHSCVQIVWVFSWIQKLSKICDTCLFSSNIKSWASWFLLSKKSSSIKVHYSQGMDKISQVDVGEKKSRTIWNVILATNSCRNEPACRLNRTVS